MIALAQHHLPLLAAPLVGGILVGWFTTGGRPSRVGWALVAAAGAIGAGAVAAAALAIVPGAAGLLLDTGLVFALTYLAGCGIGLAIRIAYLPHEPDMDGAPSAD